MAHSWILVFFFFFFSTCSGGKKRASPNIIFMLMDDIGWNDVSFNGGQFSTPNIDWLHSNGVSLNRHYIHLMCSPSRSQIITGRYAMYNGYGKMLPWDYTEIGGIPRGQPTIASWLSTMGGYTTYAIGKWHLGYAADLLLPTTRGFDHFYGFYQGAIHYDNLKYIDIKYGDSNHFDFWQDNQQQSILANDIQQRQTSILEYQQKSDLRDYIPDDNEINYEDKSIFDDNTMYLYRNKILQYIDSQIYNSKKTKPKKQKNMNPFYMYVALQTIHGPLNEVPEKINECQKILAEDATNRRQKYCQNMLLTDDIVGDIINKLREIDDVWSNTLIVFTSDNGGDIANKGCNYPLRGTKGTLFDGNLRTIALVSGGIIPSEQFGTQRDALFSSLDWTPTLLKYANLLSKINKKDFTWDGTNQYDLIMTGNEDKKRDHIVMNIGLKNLDSASIVFTHPDDNKLYKYIAKSDAIDRWAYIRDDGWCVPDEDGNFNLILDEQVSLAHAIDNRFLFCLTDDIAEKTNLLQLDNENDNNKKMIEYAKGILQSYTQHYLYSEPLTFLWNRLPAGNPSLLGEGAFVAPFLNEQQYTWHLRKGFSNINEQYSEDDQVVPYSKALQSLFFNSWQPPNDATGQQIMDENNEGYVFATVPISNNANDNVNVWLIVCVVIAICIAVLYSLYKRYYGYNRYAKDGYQVIEGNEEDTHIIMQ